MDDLADVEIEREAVGRSDRNGGQVLVEIVRLGFSRRPVQHHVRGGHDLHAMRVRVDRVLAGIHRLDPHALLALVHEIAMLERVPGHILSFTSDVRDHHADVGDRDDGRLFDFNGGEPRVDEIAARENDLLLQSLAAARVDERLRVLK